MILHQTNWMDKVRLMALSHWCLSISVSIFVFFFFMPMPRALWSIAMLWPLSSVSLQHNSFTYKLVHIHHTVDVYVFGLKWLKRDYVPLAQKKSSSCVNLFSVKRSTWRWLKLNKWWSWHYYLANYNKRIALEKNANRMLFGEDGKCLFDSTPGIACHIIKKTTI